LQGWLDKWAPASAQAARELQPIWSQPGEKAITFADSWAAATEDFKTLIAEFGLTAPKEL
jgi:propane monooxygenase small subunit